MSATRKGMKRVWLTLAAAVVLVLGLVGWATLVEDWDFHRPEKPLTCEEPPADGQPVRFIAFGDYGLGTPFQKQLADQMAKLYAKKPFSTALLLGDNIYENGDIKRYAKPFFEVPYAPLIQHNVHFVAAIGNHDNRKGHMKDQIAYFKMPGDYYKVSNGPVDFFILNTTYFVRNPEQRAWLEKSLSESKATWKIVVGHHPLYSSGRNGNTKGLKDILEPLLVKYDVDLYLCGHDHDYERFKTTHGVNYIVSGGGGGFLTNFKKILPNSAVHYRTHNFIFAEIQGKDIWIKTINRFGDVIDCIHWKKLSTTAARLSL